MALIEGSRLTCVQPPPIQSAVSDPGLHIEAASHHIFFAICRIAPEVFVGFRAPAGLEEEIPVVAVPRPRVPKPSRHYTDVRDNFPAESEAEYPVSLLDPFQSGQIEGGYVL